MLSISQPSRSLVRFLTVLAIIGLVCRVSQLVTVDPLSGNIILSTRPRPWYLRYFEPYYTSSSWGWGCLLDDWDPQGLFHPAPGWLDGAYYAVFGRDCGVYALLGQSWAAFSHLLRDFTISAFSDSLPAAVSSLAALAYAAVFGVVPLMMAGAPGRGGGGRGGGRGRGGRDRRRRAAGRGHLQAVAQALADGQAQQAGERDAAREMEDAYEDTRVHITLPISPDRTGELSAVYDVTPHAPFSDLDHVSQLELYNVLISLPPGSVVAGVPRTFIECVNEDTRLALVEAEPHYDTILVPLDDGVDDDPPRPPTHVFFPVSWDARLYTINGLPNPVLYFGAARAGGWVWGRYSCRYDNHTRKWVVGTDGFWRHGIDVSDRELIPVWGGISRLGRTGVAFGLSGVPGLQFYPGGVSMLATTLTGPFNDSTPAIAMRLVIQYVQTEGLVFSHEAVELTVKRGMHEAIQAQGRLAPMRRNATWWNKMAGFGENRPDSTVPADVFFSCIPMGLLPALLVALVLSGRFVRWCDPPWRHVVLRGGPRWPLLFVSFVAAVCLRLNRVTPMAGAILLFLLHISYNRTEFCVLRGRVSFKKTASGAFVLFVTIMEHCLIWHPDHKSMFWVFFTWSLLFTAVIPAVPGWHAPAPAWARGSVLSSWVYRPVQLLIVVASIVAMCISGPGMSREMVIAAFESLTYGQPFTRFVAHFCLASSGPFYGLFLHVALNTIATFNARLLQRDWRRARKAILKRARPLELIQAAALHVATFNYAFWSVVHAATRPYFLVTSPFSSKMMEDGSEWGYVRGMRRVFSQEPQFSYCMAYGPLVAGYLPGVVSQSHYNVAAAAATRLLRPITVERDPGLWFKYCGFVRSCWPPIQPVVDIFEPGVFERWVERFPPSARKMYRQAWTEVTQIIRGMTKDMVRRGLFVKVELAMEHILSDFTAVLNSLRPKNPRAILSCSPHYNVLVGVALFLVKDRIVQYFDDQYSARFTTGLTNEEVGAAWDEVSEGCAYTYETDHTVFDAHFDYATEELMQTFLVRFGVPRWISMMMLHMVWKRCKHRSLIVSINEQNSDGMRGSGEPQTSLVNTLHNLLGTRFVCLNQGIEPGLLVSGDNATIACQKPLDVERAMRDWARLRFQIKIDKCDPRCPTYCSGVFMLGKLVPKVARILTRVGWSHDAFKLRPTDELAAMEEIKRKHVSFVARQMVSKWLGLLYVCSGHPVLDPFFRHLLGVGPTDAVPKAPPRRTFEWGMYENRLRAVTDESRAWFLNRYGTSAENVLGELLDTLGCQVPGGPVVVGDPACFAVLAKVDL